MAEGVLASLEKEYRPLLAPKLLSEAKAIQVVWARVKGYPAWPAQVLTEAAALRRKDLGQERHSKGNSIPVMFFGTVEVAWVKDADVVDFKEGLHQGFFDRKTKPFKLALEQVCEYLALDRKRKAPPKWWCKPPSNGLDEQSDGPATNAATASGSGAAKGAAQRQEAPKEPRQRTAAPAASSESSSSDEDEAAARQPLPKQGAAKASAKDASHLSSMGKGGQAGPAPVTKPRDSSTGRLARDNGSTAVSSNGTLQAQARKPPTAPTSAPGRQQQTSLAAAREAGKDAKVLRNTSTPATSASKQTQPPPQSQRAPKAFTGGSTALAKEYDGGLPPRKRIKLEATPVGTSGPAAGTASSVPKQAPPPAKGTSSPAHEVPSLDVAGLSVTDVLKLPAEIRRLAGIRVPAVPKKAGSKVEPSPREHVGVKEEPHAVTTTADVDAPSLVKVKEEEPKAGPAAKCTGRNSRNSRGSRPSDTAGDNRVVTRATSGKRSRRSRSTDEEAVSASSSDSEEQEEEDGDDDEEAQTSGEEADSEAAASSSGSGDESEDSESEEDTSDSDADDEREEVEATHKRRKSPVARRTRGSVVQAQRQSAPARDRRGEKQRRLARLAAPEPADRRTSSRLVPKPAEKPAQATAKAAEKRDSGTSSSSESSADSSEEDEREASSASSSGSDAEDSSTAKESSRSADAGVRLRSGTKCGDVSRPMPTRRSAGLEARQASAGPSGQRRSREGSQPADRTAKQQQAAAGDASEVDESKKQSRGGQEGAAAAAPTAAPVKAIPLELRRLQDSASATLPVVDTNEPRVLRERASPARRAVGSAAATPTQTGGTAGTPSRRADKRVSDDGSEVSTSREIKQEQALDRTKSVEPPRDEAAKGSAAPEGKVVPKAGRAQPVEGSSSIAESAAGSASPPPAGPLPGAVPVRKKPPSLGVPSNGRPAILPGRGVLRTLTSKRDSQPPPTSVLPTGTSAGTSAAGALSPVAVCVAKKPSTGPPTRRVMEPGTEPGLAFVDLPDMSAVDAEADAKHASSPDVAAAAVGPSSHGPLPRSPEPVSQEDVGQQTPVVAETAAIGTTATVADDPMDSQQERRSSPTRDELGTAAAAAAQQTTEEPCCEAATRSCDEAPAPVLQCEELVGMDVPGRDTHLQTQCGVADGVPQPMEVEPQPAPEDLRKAGAHQQPLDGDATTAQQTAVAHPPSVSQDQAPSTSTAVVDPVNDRSEVYGSATEVQPSPVLPQAAAPPPCTQPSSPIREDALLAEEQLLDQGDERPVLPMEGPSSGRACSTLAVRHSLTDMGPPSALPMMAACAISEPLARSLAPWSLAVHDAAPASTAVGGALRCLGAAATSREAKRASAGGAGMAVDDDEAARGDARELEELGEVAAALAGLHQAEVPRPLAVRPVPQASLGDQYPAVGPAGPDPYSDRSRGRYGRDRCGAGLDSTPAGSSTTTIKGFRWPQPEPILPAQDQSFALPRDWLVTRPPRYEPVKRNMWLSRNKPKRLPRDEISICACRAPPLSPPGEWQRLGCGVNCLNRLSSILCDPKMCPCGDLCSNRSLHLLRQPKTEPFLTENRGWGVRALEPVYKGSFIIEYAGEVIDERELGRRMAHARMNGEPHFYIMELSAGLYIDARRKGNTARLINSSCEPNCETQKWHDAATGEVRVGIFATRDINPGEELVYDYFFSTYGAIKQSAAAFICMCGSKNCRGTMDLHPEKRRDLGRRVEVFWDADGQYYRAVIVAYHPTSRKHTVMYEDGGTEKLSLDEVPHRWLEEDPTKTSPPKAKAQQADQKAAGQAAPSGLAAQATGEPGQQPKQQSPQTATQPSGPSTSRQAPTDDHGAHTQQLQQRSPRTVAAAATSEPGRCAGAVSLPVAVAQPPPRTVLPAEPRCALPPLGSSSTEGAAQAQEALGKHGPPDGDLPHLPLKKRPRLMPPPQSQSHLPCSQQPGVQHQEQLHGDAMCTTSPSSGAPAGASHPQGSGGSGGVLTGGRTGHSSGGAEDSGSGDGNALSGRNSHRQELSGTGSGRVSGVAADEDASDDLDSLLEAAEAVAALRTAPINPHPHHVTALSGQDPSLLLQPRHIRSGPAASVAMVQTAKVASPRHLAAVHRSGPPSGLPPHGGSAAVRPAGTATNPNASSSSSGLLPHHSVGRQQQHLSSAWARAGYNGKYHQDVANGGQQYEQPGRNGRFSVPDGDDGVNGEEPSRERDRDRELGPNGYGTSREVANGDNGGNGSLDREDLLWRLVGIEKPKDLLPLFAGGCDKSRNADREKADSWIAPSHPYGKLLRALEASELLPHAEQLRLYAQQQQQSSQQKHHHHHQQQQQQLPTPQQRFTPGHSQAQHPQQQTHQAHAASNTQTALPQQPQTNHVAAAAAVAPTAQAQALALSAWQHAAQHLSRPGGAQAAAAAVAAHAASLGAQGSAALDGSAASIAAFLHAQQQQHAAAAAAAAALAASAGHQIQALGQAQPVHGAHGHGAHAVAAAAAAAAAALAGSVTGQQHHHVAAGGWPQVAQHAQQGHILHDLVHMYVAQHAAGSQHPALAMAGMAAAVGGPPRCA